MKNVQAKAKPAEIKSENEVIADIGLNNEIFPPEKQEQAVAVAIDKLGNFTGDNIKGFSDIKQTELFTLVKLRGMYDAIGEANGGKDKNGNYPASVELYKIIADEYLKHVISRDRKGRGEVVEIARVKSDMENPRISFVKKLMGGSI